MNFFSLLTFFTSSIVLFCGVFIFSKDTKDKAIQLFFIFSLVTSLVAIFEFFFINSHSLHEAMHWLNFDLMSWPILYAIQLHFLIQYSAFQVKQKKLFLSGLYTITFVVIVGLSFFNIFDTVSDTGNGWIRIPRTFTNTPEFIFSVLMSSLTLAISFVGARFHIKSSEGKAKIRSRLVLYGILITTWGPFLKNAILPNTFHLVFILPDSPFIFAGWSLIVIAIVYFKMFNLSPKNVGDKIVETMDEALILTNSDGTVSYANRRFYELIEFDTEAPDQKKLDLLNQTKLEKLRLPDEYFKFKELRNKVLPITTFKNNQIYVSVSNAFLKNELHLVVGLVTVLSNINDMILAQEELSNQQKQMLKIAHIAGKSEVTTSILHNIGNILNSVNISSELINQQLSKSKLSGLLKANEMVIEHRDELANFLTNDPKGKLLPDYYIKLGLELVQEQEKLKLEGENLYQKIKLIKEAIDIQQDYSRVTNMNESIILNNMIDEVNVILEDSLLKNNIIIQKEYDTDKEVIVVAPTSKLLNVLLNVVKNAADAVKLNDESERLIRIKLLTNDLEFVQIIIADNGIGIPAEILASIFSFGYTTKQAGHGFGLHFCANVLKEMNGSIEAKSNGLNNGAEFIIVIPRVPK